MMGVLCTLLIVRRKYAAVIICTIMCLLGKSRKPSQIGIHMRTFFFLLEVDTNVVVVFAYIYVLIYLHSFHFVMVNSLECCD